MTMRVRIIPVTAFQQNCALVSCSRSGRGALVDPGGDLDRILIEVERAGVAVEKILVTHGHIDHAGAVADAAERLGVPIEGPQLEDRFWIDGLEQQAAMFGLPVARPFTPDRWLEDGDEVSVGELRLAVIHCPGHTPGHVVFHSAIHRVALVGDVLFRGSIGRTDFPRGDQATLLRSIREKLFPLGDEVRFFCGHGPDSTFGEERRSNPFVGERSQV